jgi:hypothetical protein
MTEIDFSREAVPYRRGRKQYFKSSEEDNFLRTTLLPKLWQLEDDERVAFDSRIVSDFEPDATGPMRHVASLVLRRLTMEDLNRLSSELPDIN